jgi:hypothetical protein
MNSIEIDSSDLFVFYPNAKNSLEKLTEAILHEHSEILSFRKEMLESIRRNHPLSFQIMADCLRFNPSER